MWSNAGWRSDAGGWYKNKVTAATGFLLNNSQSASLSPTNTSFTTSSFSAAANCVNVIAVALSGASTLSITDSIGSTYTMLGGLQNGNVSLWAAPITAAQSGNILTFTLGTTQTLSYALGAFTGCNMAAPIDTSATNQTGGTPSWTTTAFPTTLIGAMGPSSGSITTISSPWEFICTPGSFCALVYDRNVATAQSGTTFTSDAGGFFGSVVSALK